eukprot:1154357-Pelagomonas_calceolata.AAC.1
MSVLHLPWPACEIQQHFQGSEPMGGGPRNAPATLHLGDLNHFIKGGCQRFEHKCHSMSTALTILDTNRLIAMATRTQAYKVHVLSASHRPGKHANCTSAQDTNIQGASLGLTWATWDTSIQDAPHKCLTLTTQDTSSQVPHVRGSHCVIVRPHKGHLGHKHTLRGLKKREEALGAAPRKNDGWSSPNRSMTGKSENEY